MAEIDLHIRNRDWESIDATRLTEEHLDEIASIIGERITYAEDNYLSEGSPYWEYTSSYAYGERAPSFSHLENNELGDYLLQSFKSFPKETMDLLTMYITTDVGVDVYTSDNAIFGSYLHNEEVELFCQDLGLEGLDEFMCRLLNDNEVQFSYLTNRVNAFTKISSGEVCFYTSVTGKIENILDVDALLEDMRSLVPALRLTDTNPVVRNFPQELLED